jgi:hypothetical protein
MVKARAAPATELLEDVTRTPQPASSEVLSWRHPFALYHFLEGVQGRCPRQALRQALLGTASPARRCHAPGKDLPSGRKEGENTSPPLQGGKLACEDTSPSREKVAYERRLGTCPKGQDLQACGERIPQGYPMSPSGNVHGGCATEFHCGDLQKE